MQKKFRHHIYSLPIKNPEIFWTDGRERISNHATAFKMRTNDDI